MATLGANFSKVDVTPTFGLGNVAVDEAGGKAYKYVQYTTASGPVAAVAGNVVYYYAPLGVSAGAVSVVTSDVSDSANVGAGVLQSAPLNNQYCWIQIRGVATLNTALGAGADGNALTAVGAGDGTLTVNAALTSKPVAAAIDASAKLITCDFPF